MKLPTVLTPNKRMVCPTCSGERRVVVRKFVVGKGTVLAGRKCPSCNGRGTLPRR